MTREEAIYEIKQLAVLSTDKEIPKITEALNMAIEALQGGDAKYVRSKCEVTDTISRADAIKAIMAIPDGNWKSSRYAKAINALPSADRPTNTPTDLISRADAIKTVGDWMQKEYGYLDLNRAERLIDALSALPSAEAEQTIRHIENNTKESDLVYRPSAEAEDGTIYYVGKKYGE